MRESLLRSGNSSSKRLAAIDQLLIAGIKLGPAKQRDAINRVLALVPEWRRSDCWERIRHLRKTSELVALDERHAGNTTNSGRTGKVRRSSGIPWTREDDDKLFKWAGYEPVKKIAQRLRRSVSAVRFRLGARGLSAKVTDGWSLRELRKMLRVSPARLRYLIGTGMLKVRDPRVSASSLAVLCNKKGTLLDSSTLERSAPAITNEDYAYSWDGVANLLGVTVSQVQAWISAGQLHVVDTFVTDRSFEEFCRNHGEELKGSLIAPAIANWLVTEYGMSEVAANGGIVSPARRHALVVRTCQCGKTIAGNPYFRHVRACKSAGVAARADTSDTLEPSSRTLRSVQSSRST